MLVVHSHGLALGSSLKPSKLLITNKIRLRANVVGVQDLVQREQRQTIQDQQAEEDRGFSLPHTRIATR